MRTLFCILSTILSFCIMAEDLKINVEELDVINLNNANEMVSRETSRDFEVTGAHAGISLRTSGFKTEKDRSFCMTKVRFKYNWMERGIRWDGKQLFANSVETQSNEHGTTIPKFFANWNGLKQQFQPYFSRCNIYMAISLTLGLNVMGKKISRHFNIYEVRRNGQLYVVPERSGVPIPGVTRYQSYKGFKVIKGQTTYIKPSIARKVINEVRIN